METIAFKPVPRQLEVEMFYRFLVLNNWGWDKMITKQHPALKVVKTLKTKTDRLNFITQYLNQYTAQHQNIIQTRSEQHEKSWRQIEEKIFILLSQVMEIDWPQKHPPIQAFFSTLPICPRFLRNWCFFINWNVPIKRSRTIIAHEITHFLYFTQWKKVFPDSRSRTFDSPYLEWHLSELLAPVILNDPRLQKILKRPQETYQEYDSIKIGKRTVFQHLTSSYNSHLKHQTSFAAFLQAAYEDTKPLKKQLENI